MAQAWSELGIVRAEMVGVVPDDSTSYDDTIDELPVVQAQLLPAVECGAVCIDHSRA